MKYMKQTFMELFPPLLIKKLISRNLFNWDIESTGSKTVAYTILNVFGTDSCDLPIRAFWFPLQEVVPLPLPHLFIFSFAITYSFDCS